MTVPSTTAHDSPSAEPPAEPSRRALRIQYQCGGAYVSGMEIIELDIMRGLAARGHNVHCIVSGWNDGDFIARLDAAGIPHTVAFTGKISLSPRPQHIKWTVDALRRLPGARRAVRRQLRAFAPDAVVACNRDAVLMLGDVLAPYPIVYHVHEVPAVTGRTRRTMAALARRCDLFVGVSEFVGERLAELGLAPTEVRVVPNGVALPIEEEGGSASAGGSASEPFTVGICGQVGPWKGHEDLVEALGILQEHSVAFRCLVFGKGEAAFEERLRRRAAELGIGGWIEWRGFVRDQDALYRELDVLAAPSRVEETFGMVAAEAGARGIPAVVSRLGGLTEVVADGETGYLVSPGRPDELAAYLEALAADPVKRQRMGAAARVRIRKRFTTEQMVRGHEQAILEAVTAP